VTVPNCILKGLWEEEGSRCYDLAKQLSHYLYLLYFTFSFGLTVQEEVWESITLQVSYNHGHMTGSHSVILHDVT